VSLKIATNQAGSYLVTTPVYEGPLDLLLQLIERAELDITRLALAQVTDQYLAHLRAIQAFAAEEVSAFLVIAAKLLQIKSEALLPRPPIREPGEEDPGEALARQLLEYKKYRAIADHLGQREIDGLRTHLRLAPPPKIEGKLDISDIGLADLVAAAQEVLAAVDQRPLLSAVVTLPATSIREKISYIAGFLRRKGAATFHSLLGSHWTRLEAVITFLALLELVKRHLIVASQDNLFGEIEIKAADVWDEDEDFELEFGE
jgi:segregation and condensation protein A